jgi:hypothetical protein
MGSQTILCRFHVVSGQLQFSAPHFGQFIYSRSRLLKLHRLQCPYRLLICCTKNFASVWLIESFSIKYFTAWIGEERASAFNFSFSDGLSAGISIPSAGKQLLHFIFICRRFRPLRPTIISPIYACEYSLLFYQLGYHWGRRRKDLQFLRQSTQDWPVHKI